MVSASLSVPPTANFDLIILGEFSDEPVSVSASEEGSIEAIYGYDESCVWYPPSPQKVTIGVVAMYGGGTYQLVVHYGPGHKNRTPPLPPEAALHPTPEVNQRWEKWSYARYAGYNGIFFWDEGVLVNLPVPEAPLKQWEENAIRVTYLNQQLGMDGPHQPWNNFDGDGFGVDYGLYKTLEAPPGVYTIQFDVWVYEHASSTSTSVDNWLLLLVDTKREAPAVVWHYWEEPSQAQHTWRQLMGTVEIRLHTPNLYVLMGVRDGWVVDHSQGLKFHFESLRLEPLIAPNLLANPGFETGTFAPWVNTDNCAGNQIQREIVHSGQYALQMDSIYSPYPDYKYVVQPLGKPRSLTDDLVLSAAIYPTKTGPTCGQAGVAWVQVVIEDPTTNETKPINYEWSGYTYSNNDLGVNETKAVFLLFEWEPYHWHILHRSILADYTAVFGMPADPAQLRVTEVKLLNHAANGEPGTFYADDLFLSTLSQSGSSWNRGAQRNLLDNQGFETGLFAPWMNTDDCACNQIQSEIVHSGKYALQVDSIYGREIPVVQILEEPPSLAEELRLAAAIYPTKTGATCGEYGRAIIRVIIEDTGTGETTYIEYEWSGYPYPDAKRKWPQTDIDVYTYKFFDWAPNQWHTLNRSLSGDYATVFGAPSTPSQLRVTEVKLMSHASNGEPGPFYADDLFLGVASREAPTVTVVSPNGGEYWKGTQPITWIATDPQEDPLTYIVYCSSTGGQTWTRLATGLIEPSYAWDTTTVVDGRNYLIKVEASDGIQTGVDISDAVFEIANAPINTVPTVMVIRPNGGERVSGTYGIRWEANDPDGDDLTFTVYYSPNRGETWTQIATGVTEAAYLWDTSKVREGENYLIKVEVNDGDLTGEDDSDAPFSVERETETETGAAFIPSWGILEGLGAILVLLGLGKRQKRRTR